MPRPRIHQSNKEKIRLFRKESDHAQLNVTVPKDLLSMFDWYVDRHKTSKSAVVSEILQRFMVERIQEDWNELKQDMSK